MTRCATSLAAEAVLDRRAARLAQAGVPGTMALSRPDYIGSIPPIGGGGVAGSSVTRSQVEAFGALYYHGELDASGLMTIAELMVEERFTLNIRDRVAFEALEAMATEMNRGWYDAERRNQIFVPTLGFGSGNDVRRALQNLTAALTRYEREISYGPASFDRIVNVDFAMSAMLDTVGRRGSLGLERAATVLNGQLRLALAVVGNTSIQRQFGAREMWDLLGILLDDGSGGRPDFTQISGRAESGAAIFGWIAQRIDQIRRRDGSLSAHLRNDATLFRRAIQWQMSSGDRQSARSGFGGAAGPNGQTAAPEPWGGAGYRDRDTGWGGGWA